MREGLILVVIAVLMMVRCIALLRYWRYYRPGWREAGLFLTQALWATAGFIVLFSAIEVIHQAQQ